MVVQLGRTGSPHGSARFHASALRATPFPAAADPWRVGAMQYQVRPRFCAIEGARGAARDRYNGAVVRSPQGFAVTGAPHGRARRSPAEIGSSSVIDIPIELRPRRAS